MHHHVRWRHDPSERPTELYPPRIGLSAGVPTRAKVPSFGREAADWKRGPSHGGQSDIGGGEKGLDEGGWYTLRDIESGLSNAMRIGERCGGS